MDQDAFGRAKQLGLEGCDSTLPPKQEKAVKAVVAEVASSLDGERVCDELV